jgi:hypothetical protein
MTAQVRYRQTLEAVAVVPPGADPAMFESALSAVMGEVATRCRMDKSDVIVRWGTTDDGGVEYRAVINESDSDTPPVAHRPGMRDPHAAMPLGDRVERTVAEHRAEAAP